MNKLESLPGREAEIWPRDYSMLARRVQFLR
ncbi:hypothetical protein JGD72_23075, partial [Salmonella enterica subsp. enterica serovar Typhimurium]|nr:hypothetical protein [Salmonella enterica subsp. enterica serovar Typhimurium]